MPQSDHLCYEFGPYRLDPAKRVLSRNGETISLRPKATEILMMLVMHAGELVEKDELLNEVWPNTFVEEANLTQNIFKLRRALGHERSGPKYIETVARRGYRFVASVRIITTDDKESLPAEVAASQPPVVAVLPFLNTTGDQELEYLADGVTDNIINNLSRLSKLRVMSRSTVLRYKVSDVDPKQVGRELGANVVLVGKINSRPTGIAMSVELVDASSGWQLWGESFDSESKDLLEIQTTITRQLLTALKLSLTGDEEKQVTARHTENGQAYQSYLQGRYHWSRYTKKGMEKAIGHFRHAIELDPNYALAYAGIVDCYLRLATSYLPPDDDIPRSRSYASKVDSAQIHESNPKVKLRYEWDWKGAQRERRRANELKADYPSAHQWYAAFEIAQQLYRRSILRNQANRGFLKGMNLRTNSGFVPQIPSVQLTPTEEAQILCTVAREHIAIGNFDAAEMILERWYQKGRWPKLDSLKPHTAADLLFTLGTLIGWVGSTRRIKSGQKEAESFLCGSVALFEQLGAKTRSIEARMELARCYYRQGLFEIARETVSVACSELPDDQMELKTICLVTWGVIERDSGRLKDSLIKLQEAASVEVTDPLITGRCNNDLATTLKELAVSEQKEIFFDEAESHFLQALYECEAVGHHRFAAAVENNMGFLLLSRGSHQESEKHLSRARRLFDCLSDSVRGAQVNETLARLYIETTRYTLAQEVIEQAIATLELTDGEALLAEALATHGVVAARQGRYDAAKRSFEAAYKVAERCRDNEGAGRALLLMSEEVGDRLDQAEKLQVSQKLRSLFSNTQQSALLIRVDKSVGKLAPHTEKG
jgi:DNA-binding winged helix-turn-helix (wHTH) protein/tetratricopeptide (TPR) repeat protein